MLTYIRERKYLHKAGGLLAGLYYTRKYISERIEDVRETMDRERAARDGLKRRFRQTHENMGYMVMTLLPTLADQIRQGMDVEGVIDELRSLKSGSQNMESSIASLVSTTSSLDSPSSSSSPSLNASPQLGPQKSKAQLWNTTKTMTITRLLTIIYSSTLLSLLTLVQMSILARHQYVAAVFQQCRDERLRESMEEQLSIASLLFSGGSGLEDLMSGNMDALFPDLGSNQPEDDGAFLTLSWWLLHEGWRDISRRVRTAVDDVLGSASLRQEITPSDLFDKIRDIRKRVEKDTTFVDAMLPPSDEMTMYALGRGGFEPADAPPSPIVPASIHESGEVSDSEMSWLDSASQYSLPTQSQQSLLSGPPSEHRSATPPTAVALPQTLVPLLAEAHEVFASPDWKLVLKAALDVGVSVWESDAAGAWKSTGTVMEEPRQSLASLLPALAKWNVMSLPTPLVDRILATYEPTALSAVIFGKFEDEVGER
ncbi:hypothetical protein CYLTODRAFT_419839 [Cylindrobasidium torrendii FP15055 ss-10]|uniref:Peroxin-3 n=1 Tax=Cylindrobasidium torrendii FP15055 ss-10 TaxID=1314674 RepID=A0A0D7BIU1_9AGAR|nr:hypothetical protein CYLTODRAFT_419839 [Cylindrobasidium torrendii FP15055 ss-10]